VFKGVPPLAARGSERIDNPIQLLFPEPQSGFRDIELPANLLNGEELFQVIHWNYLITMFKSNLGFGDHSKISKRYEDIIRSTANA